MARKKTAAAPPPEVDPAAEALEGSPQAGKCTVCGDPVAQFSEEQLCWVCRRLKISAWHEADNQLSAQE